MEAFTEGEAPGASEPVTTALGLSGLVCPALRRTPDESVGSGWVLEVTALPSDGSTDGADDGVARGTEVLLPVAALAGVSPRDAKVLEDMGVSHLPI